MDPNDTLSVAVEENTDKMEEDQQKYQSRTHSEIFTKSKMTKPLDVYNNINQTEEKSSLKPLIVSKIRETINGSDTVFEQIKTCFIEQNINYGYFQNHTRKQFVQLLRGYNIKVSAAVKLYESFIEDGFDRYNNTNYKTSQERNLSNKLNVIFSGYSRASWHGRCQELIKICIFYYGINQQHLDIITWSELELIKCQSTNSEAIKSVSITEEAMMKRCIIAINNDNHNLIPIVVHDRHEWVLIVDIIDEECIGLSFRYNKKSNIFVATAIYSNKTEIESKHKLVGLKYNYCNHLKPFNLSKFQFVEDDGDIIGCYSWQACNGSVEH